MRANAEAVKKKAQEDAEAAQARAKAAAEKARVDAEKEMRRAQEEAQRLIEEGGGKDLQLTEPRAAGPKARHGAAGLKDNLRAALHVRWDGRRTETAHHTQT